MTRRRHHLSLALAAGIGMALAAAPAQAWEPKQPIEFVIQTSPGGGSDQYARYWIGIIEKYKLSPQPVIPVNKPGGAGAAPAVVAVDDEVVDGDLGDAEDHRQRVDAQDGQPDGQLTAALTAAGFAFVLVAAGILSVADGARLVAIEAGRGGRSGREALCEGVTH